MKKIQQMKDYKKHIETTYLKELPDLSVGQSVRIGILIGEGTKDLGKENKKTQEENKERRQYYEGIILASKNIGINKTITVRRVSQGVGIERIFLIHSPRVVSIEKKKQAKVRRSKLYFLRNLKGKKNKLKEEY